MSERSALLPRSWDAMTNEQAVSPRRVVGKRNSIVRTAQSRGKVMPPFAQTSAHTSVAAAADCGLAIGFMPSPTH